MSEIPRDPQRDGPPQSDGISVKLTMGVVIVILFAALALSRDWGMAQKSDLDSEVTNKKQWDEIKANNREISALRSSVDGLTKDAPNIEAGLKTMSDLLQEISVTTREQKKQYDRDQENNKEQQEKDRETQKGFQESLTEIKVELGKIKVKQDYGVIGLRPPETAP